MMNADGSIKLRWGDGDSPDGGISSANINYTDRRYIVGTYD